MQKLVLVFSVFFLAACDPYRGGVREGLFHNTVFPVELECALEALNSFPEIQHPWMLDASEKRKSKETSFVYTLDGMRYWLTIFAGRKTFINKKKSSRISFMHGNTAVEYRLPRLQSFEANALLLEEIELRIADYCQLQLDSTTIKTTLRRFQSG